LFHSLSSFPTQFNARKLASCVRERVLDFPEFFLAGACNAFDMGLFPDAMLIEKFGLAQYEDVASTSVLSEDLTLVDVLFCLLSLETT